MSYTWVLPGSQMNTGGNVSSIALNPKISPKGEYLTLTIPEKSIESRESSADGDQTPCTGLCSWKLISEYSSGVTQASLDCA